jgi:tetratricopeptide (TPR) repeat protein
MWISGVVMMYDGTAPPDGATIERICSSNSAHSEAHTDSKGYFSFALGQSNGLVPDASEGRPNMPGLAGPLDYDLTSPTGATQDHPIPETAYWGCDIRARASGFRSSTISLAGHRFLDNPDIGAIILYPIAKIEGLTVSATSEQAPKNARKAYENGLDAIKKKKPDQAEKEFQRAVELYPKYAAAWLELGKALERRQQDAEARAAYQQALAADSKYLFPYQQLYQLAFKEKNWQEVADKTGQLIRLDAFEFPDAYYFNGVAEMQLKNFDAAEKSARRALELDRRHTNPRTHYLLGAILERKNDLTGAAASLRAYLVAVPNAAERTQIETFLAQVEKADQVTR